MKTLSRLIRINLVVLFGILGFAYSANPQEIKSSGQPAQITHSFTAVDIPSPTIEAAGTKPIIETADNSCLITIDGASYDVSEFRKAHSGGDVFSCGTDASSTFWNRHTQRELSILQRFKI